MSKTLILMSTYNGEKYLDAQIESIKAQSYTDWELLIRDDGSTDSTLDIIKKHLSKQIQLYSDQAGNLKPTQSFKTLVCASQAYQHAEYFCFADQDDVWHSNKLAWSLAAIDPLSAMPILVHTDLAVVDKNLSLIHPSFWKYQNTDPHKNQLSRLLVQNTVTGCTMLFNKALRNELLHMPESAALHDWWAALVAAAWGQIIPLPLTTVSYRQHDQNHIGAIPCSWKAIPRIRLNTLQERCQHRAKQAEAFLHLYKNRLTPKQIKAITYVCCWDKLSLIKKMDAFLRYGIRKQGWMRNVVLLSFS